MDKQTEACEAAKILFETYGDEIYRYVRFTLGNCSDTEDIVQDIFLKVLCSWTKFAHRSAPRTWLWSITRNHLKDVIRKRTKDNDHLLKGHEHLPDVPVHDSTIHLELEDSLRLLTLPQRQVFTLRVILENTNVEAAQILGCTPLRVRVTLHRALKKLEVLLRDNN